MSDEKKKTWKKALKSVMITFLNVLILLILALLVFQRHLLYMPRAHEPFQKMKVEQIGESITYYTTQGYQVAYYIPPNSEIDELPAKIWIVLSGNGTIALDWLYFAEDFADSDTAFYLVDIPGYGESEGRAAPKRNKESFESAVTALAAHLELEESELVDRLYVLGHSLGAANALILGASFPEIDNYILISPFSSTYDMAKRMVGWPLCMLLHHRYDNYPRMKEIIDANPHAHFDIIHGTDDQVIPYSMGEDLAAAFSDYTVFHPIEGGDHNMIMVNDQSLIFDLMRKSGVDQQAVEDTEEFE